MNKTLTTRASRLITVVIAFILVVLPFHEFLTTWLGSNFGHLDLFRVWKEIVLVLLIFPTSYLVLKKKQLLSFLIRDKLTILIVIFGIICLVIGIWGYETKSVNAAALSAGLIIDLRFFLIFLICLVITCYNDFFKKYWKQLLLIPALLVIVFGIAQIFLPLNFLSHFGYGANTIPAYQTIDQNLRFHRIQSTLRGADPLGAYLILIAPVPLFFITKRLWQRITIIFASLITVFYTYSRSAYVGLLLAVGYLFYKMKLNPKQKKLFFISILVLICVGFFGVFTFRNNLVVEDVFFHISTASKSSTSSNSVRFSALKANLDNVINHPFGQGVGSAGPASFHNNKPAKIAENFYIQIAQETGILGLIVFLTINIIVVYRLYVQDNQLALLLLASFIGITFVNMVSHAWADDTLSLIWWAFAGVALSPTFKNLKKTK